MESISVFNFTNYRLYLTKVIQSRPKKGRGMKSSLAQAAGCQVAYLSRVFAEQADFSLEQADAINVFLGHSEEEAHYFLLMIQNARAGTPRLRGSFLKQMETIQKKRLVLKERFQVKESLSAESQVLYYSSWLYAAVHMCITVSTLQNKEAIADYLGASVAKISEVLEFLQATGLAAYENGRYQIGRARVHLGNDSPLIAQHHTNWRIRAVGTFDREDSSRKHSDLHYSSIVSLSRADQLKLKALLVKTIDEFNATVADSPEEEVHCLALDFFKV